MREILFRGKREDNDEWVCGYYCQCVRALNCGKTKPAIQQADDGSLYFREVIAETVGQYTGLTDKNGKKIFEGDIITMPSYHGGKHKTVVYFERGKFAVDGSNYHFKDICPRNMEVIGNIHDNPELLRGTDNGE